MEARKSESELIFLISNLCIYIYVSQMKSDILY
jgi:hypothetical protein